MQIRSRYIFGLALVVLMAFSSCGQPQEPSEPAEPATPKNSLVGVWSVSELTSGDGETISPAQPGLFIFTKGHYSAVHTRVAEPRQNSGKSFEPTSEEKVAQYDSIIVNTGTYRISGSEITFFPMVAKSPEFIGGESKAEFRIKGDELTLNTETVVAKNGGSAAGPFGSMKLNRIE